MNNKELTELKREFYHRFEGANADIRFNTVITTVICDMLWNFFLPHLKSNDEVGKAPKAKYIDKYAERIITPEQELIIANGVDELQTLDSLDEINREAIADNLWRFAEHWNSVHSETQITVKELEAYLDLTQQSSEKEKK